MTNPADETKAEYRRRARSLATVVVVLGPPIGWTWAVIGFAAYMALTQSVLSGSFTFHPMLGLWMIGALYSWFAGAIPALIAAALVGLHVSVKGSIGFVQCAVIAGVVSGVYGALVEVGTARAVTIDTIKSLPPEVLILIVTSVLSALICRWLAGRMGVLPPDTPPSPVSPQS